MRQALAELNNMIGTRDDFLSAIIKAGNIIKRETDRYPARIDVGKKAVIWLKKNVKKYTSFPCDSMQDGSLGKVYGTPCFENDKIPANQIIFLDKYGEPLHIIEIKGLPDV